MICCLKIERREVKCKKGDPVSNVAYHYIQGKRINAQSVSRKRLPNQLYQFMNLKIVHKTYFRFHSILFFKGTISP
jgi:hypothetical protein